MCAVTCVYEGQSDEVNEQERRLNELADKTVSVLFRFYTVIHKEIDGWNTHT